MQITRLCPQAARDLGAKSRCPGPLSQGWHPQPGKQRKPPGRQPAEKQMDMDKGAHGRKSVSCQQPAQGGPVLPMGAVGGTETSAEQCPSRPYW